MASENRGQTPGTGAGLRTLIVALASYLLCLPSCSSAKRPEAGLRLLHGAVSTGIGVQAQQPLARVVVGGMVTSSLAIPFLLPIMASFFLQPKNNRRA